MKLLPTSLLVTAALPAVTLADYKLSTDYSGYDFVSNFDFYNGPDPSGGHVQYKGFATANQTGLTGYMIGPNGTNTYNSSLPPPMYLGVDYTNVYANDTGRPSVRISSVQSFNHSLVIADIYHMPSSTCGLWPAFWMLGTSAPWPNAGEVDIIEGVNDNNFNIMTMHTNAGITVTNDTTTFNGTMSTSNCDVNAANQEKNVGCTINDQSGTKSYGTSFNNNNGGVFAMQHTHEHVAIWFFPRSAIPADIQANLPTPPHIKDAANSPWGIPNALFKPTTASSSTSSTSSSSSSFSAAPTASTSSLSSTPTSSTSQSTTPAATTITITPVSNSNTVSTTDDTPTTPSLLDTHMSSLQLIFSTTFCGDWAGKVWNTSSTCAALAPTCEQYVSSHPEAFKEAYWLIQSVKVYENSTALNAGAMGMGSGSRSQKRAFAGRTGWWKNTGYGFGRGKMVVPF